MTRKQTRFIKNTMMGFLIMVGCALFGQGMYMSAKAQLAQVLISMTWSDNVAAKQAQAKPWPWADTTPVAKLSIAKYGISQYIMRDDSGESLAFGAGVMPVGVMPAEQGDSLVAGHRDSHFKFLQKLKVGDEVAVENVLGNKQRYKVTALDVVDTRQDRLTVLPSAHRLRLITCYPFDALVAGGPLRYVVSAEPIFT